MRTRYFTRGWLAWISLGAALLPAPVSACAVCFGKSDAPLAKGMNMGIFAMLGVVALMWVGIGSFILCLARRSARLKSGPGAAAKASDFSDRAHSLSTFAK